MSVNVAALYVFKGIFSVAPVSKTVFVEQLPDICINKCFQEVRGLGSIIVSC